MRKKQEKYAVQDKPAFIKLLNDTNRFKKLKDGWISDSLLGIEWGPSSEEYMAFKKAQTYCKKLGGRLPEVSELQSLVDYSKLSPAIDTTFFKDTKTDGWYWTGTDYAGDSGNSWMVCFYSGGVGWSYEGRNDCVRPVRPSQCLII